MALSGFFTGSTNNQYVQPKITWSAIQNIAENYSDVTATLTYSRTNSGYTTSGRWSGSLNINGTTTAGDSGGKQIYITQNSNTFAMSATTRVYHNNDGSKKITISATGTIPGASLTKTSISSEITLDTIPRQATITSVSDFTDVDNPSFTFSNPGGFPMDVWLEPNPVGDHLCVRTNIPDTGNYQWTLTEAEREELRVKSNGQLQYKIRIGLYTHIGDTTYADYKDKTFTITENYATKPKVGMILGLNNSSLPSIFDGLYIQGKSRLNVEPYANGKYGADITSLYAVIDGKTYNTAPFTSDVIQSSGNLVTYAKDSRGFTNSVSRTIEVIPYSKPLVVPLNGENAILCYRSDGNGERTGNSTSVWIKAKRTYYSVSGKNQCALQWRKKLTTEEWNDTVHLWHDLIENTDTSTDEYNAMLSGENFELKKSYTIQIRAIDDIGEYDVKTLEIPTMDVALHLGKGGKNVSVGTYCNYSVPYRFYSDWEGVFDKGLWGASLNFNVDDVLEFPKDCTDGITPIIINSSTNKANLPEGNYAYSVGIVHKRAADQYNVILMDYMSGKIAINVHLSGTWTGWKYLIPQ